MRLFVCLRSLFVCLRSLFVCLFASFVCLFVCLRSLLVCLRYAFVCFATCSRSNAAWCASHSLCWCVPSMPHCGASPPPPSRLLPSQLGRYVVWEWGQPQMAAGSMLDDFVDLLDGQRSMRDAIIAAALPRARVGSAVRPAGAVAADTVGPRRVVHLSNRARRPQRAGCLWRLDQLRGRRRQLHREPRAA